MDLNIFKKEVQKQELYWSLVIGKNWVQAAIWHVVEETVEVMMEGSTVTWEDGNIQSLIEASDGTLSSAAGGIEDNLKEPDKVVFGLSPSWMENGSISPNRLELLKKLSEELELMPSGFVVIPESIIHFLKSKEGAPLNAILLGLAEDSSDVTLVQNGKIVGTVEVSRSVSMGADLAEGLSKIAQVSQYPSRILLYDHKVGNLEDARQNLLETNWEEVKISFLHTPKVEVLGEDIAVASVSLAGGAEVGKAKKLILPQKDEDVAVNSDTEIDSSITQEGNLPQTSDVRAISPEDLGFLQGSDISNVPGQPMVKEAENEIEYEVGRKMNPRNIFTLFGGIGSLFAGIKIPTFGFRVVGILGLGSIFLLIILILGGVAYWYLPTAQVSIYVAPKILEKEFSLKVDQKAKVINQADKIIPGIIEEVDMSGDKSSQTTGTITVGERSKGQVAIYHIGGSTILKSGTFITGPGGLKFALDSDITVASSSGITSPSKASANVTAADIGAQYNLASGSKFGVGNFSKDSFEAQNDNALSGGTSRAVSAVAEDDLKTLENDLTGELISRGRDNLKKSLSEGQVLIDDTAKFVPENKIFSNKAGEEAQTIKLSLSGKITYLVISRENINLLLLSELERDVPSGYVLRQDQVTLNYKVLEAKTTGQSKKLTQAQINTSLTAVSAQATAKLLPKINPGEISQAIAGRRIDAAREYLATTPGYKKATFLPSFTLPGKLGTLPRIAKNIEIEIVADR